MDDDEVVLLRGLSAGLFSFDAATVFFFALPPFSVFAGVLISGIPAVAFDCLRSIAARLRTLFSQSACELAAW